MRPEYVAFITMGLTIAALVWNAARSFQRLERLVSDVKDMELALKEVSKILYTTVGGRRKIRPVEIANDNGQDE